MTIFDGTPSRFDRYKDQGILTFGGTPGTSSRHVSRHPGWEPLLIQKVIMTCQQIHLRVRKLCIPNEDRLKPCNLTKIETETVWQDVILQFYFLQITVRLHKGYLSSGFGSQKDPNIRPKPKRYELLNIRYRLSFRFRSRQVPRLSTHPITI